MTLWHRRNDSCAVPCALVLHAWHRTPRTCLCVWQWSIFFSKSFSNTCPQHWHAGTARSSSTCSFVREWALIRFLTDSHNLQYEARPSEDCHHSVNSAPGFSSPQARQTFLSAVLPAALLVAASAAVFLFLHCLHRAARPHLPFEHNANSVGGFSSPHTVHNFVASAITLLHRSTPPWVNQSNRA